MDMQGCNTFLSAVDMEEHILQHKDDIAQSLYECISTLVTTYPSDKKGPLKYIVISFLRTGVLNHTPFYRVDCYDSNKYRDLVEHSLSWNVPFVSNMLSQKTEDVTTNNISDLVKYEHEQMQNAVMFQNSLETQFAEICQIAIKRLQPVEKKWVCIFFGEYLGESKYICTLEGTN